MQFGTSGPRGKAMKRSTSGVKRSKAKVMGGEVEVIFGGLVEASFSTPLGRVGFCRAQLGLC